MNNPRQPPSQDLTFNFPPNLYLPEEDMTRIRIPPTPPVPLRRSSRHRTASDSAGPSGSEYHESDKSMEVPHEEEREDEPPIEYVRSSRGRKIVKKRYIESTSEDDGIPKLFDDEDQPNTKRSNRHSHDADADADGDDEDEVGPGRYPLRGRRSRPTRSSFIVSDDEDTKLNNSNGRYPIRNRVKPPAHSKPPLMSTTTNHGISQRARRLSRRNANRTHDEEDVYIDHTSSGASADADGSLDDVPHTSSDLEPEPEPEPEPGEAEEEGDGKPYALRARQRINYAIPPPLEEMRKPPPKAGGGGRNGRSNGIGYHGGHGKAAKNRGPGWSASGAELGRWMGMAGDDSDSDHATRTPRKPFGGAGFGAIAGAAGGMLDLAAGGTPSNHGKISGQAVLADADPLGVNVNVTFDEVGGLDEHIHALKEMTLLPLLYPEVFQRFNVTPPRGVLFHGPPGTGKTLLARALAASCRSDGRSISFFMRKGADCLSKWVGEAERQLRLLFEEARASQPSIIFFDEIDGLAPVRSAKQDQIHASIVSTLLALMDGMDGRGQVVVIGATNRPDAVDPALRRPGRFDREFYFGLPGLDARERILEIMTKGWVGWGEEVAQEEEKGDKESSKEEEMVKIKKRWKGSEKLKGLAKLTKGYGGADLRALCTEAALNAIQRKYPQIYQSNERLLLKPESIGVGLRDFMISIKKLVPSSARSTSSIATPLPPQFSPLLNETLERVKAAIGRVIPMEKRLTALEEAMFEDDDGEEGALEREMLMQSMQTLRVYRPRIILHGPVGMGQTYVGAAALHHLEGYHIQSLELGTLMGDATRSIEAAIVQLFVEAKRHQPSVIYIPSLLSWCAAVPETSRSTVRAMLDTLASTDPILLLVVVDGHFSELPPDVKAWFGSMRDNRIELLSPSFTQRAEFFEALVKDVRRPPNHFADGVKRKRRVLEKLPTAPPPPPRQPTAAELALQEESDQKMITLLKYRLGPIVTELKRKFRRFTKRATEEYHFEIDVMVQPEPLPATPVVVTTQIEQPLVNGTINITEDGQQPPISEQPVADGLTNGILHHDEQQPEPEQQQMVVIQVPQLFDIDLEKIHADLFKGRYLTPQDFLDDVGKMVHNANVRVYEDMDRLYKAQAMFTAAEVSIQEFDPQFRMECERMAVRERRRREERRQEKEKEKEKEREREKDKEKDRGPLDENGQGNGMRRSGRNNGQQPEHPITDPVKLERRLKRQRSNEAASDSHASEEENNESREAKRTRMIDVDSDRDPLNILSPAPLPHPRVHFASETEPMQMLEEVSIPNNRDSDVVMNDPPQQKRFSGFNPLLLNPMPSPDTENNPFYNENIPSSNENISSSNVGDVPSTPTASTPPPVHLPINSPNPFLSAESMSQVPSPPRASSEHYAKSPEPQNVPSSPTPMVIERTPTPLPDFCVDEGLMTELQRCLQDDTAFLTIEKLEELRATCLGSVWRHRTDWNRDALVRELLDVIREFLETADSLDI